jgi:sigma-B regulation protein RsbU (phosphoserine phosphatase)
MEPVVMIVDDNDDNRFTLSMRLESCGYSNLITAENGREALEKMRSGSVDLVLLDIMMPEMNGYEVLQHLKASAELRDVPVIVISALDEMESVIKCIELGAEDYLAKPFNPTLLRARVGASLEKKRLRDEVRASRDRLQQELNAARTLQLGMLPRAFPALSSEQPVQVYAFMEPAREVGGDLYDCFYASKHVFCFLVGDVSGKGAPAAMFMARTRSLVRMAVEFSRDFGNDDTPPANIAEAVNRELYQNNTERMFVTLFLGFLNTRTGALAYINAGHPPPHLLRAADDIGRLDGKPEVPLGVRRDTAYQSRVAMLDPGDAVFLHTDGVTEAMNISEELFTTERLNADLHAARTGAPEEIVRAVKEHVDAFTGLAPKADDVTMLALRWHAAASDQWS